MTRDEYVAREYAPLLGKTIQSARPLTQEECDAFGWNYETNFGAVIITFTDGSWLVPMSDAEGNNSGHIFLSY